MIQLPEWGGGSSPVKTEPPRLYYCCCVVWLFGCLVGWLVCLLYLLYLLLWCCCGVVVAVIVAVIVVRTCHPIGVAEHLGVRLPASPPHPRALNNQQLLAVEGSLLGLDVQMDGVKNAVKIHQNPSSDALDELDDLSGGLPDIPA